MKFVPAVIAVSAAAALALSGCSSSKSASSSSTSAGGSSSAAASSSAPALTGSITVFAASSLTGTFNDLGKSFMAAHPGTTVTFNYGSSGTLSTQITQGAPADVFASAATKNMQTVVDAKDAATPTNFVKNTMEIAVPTANPAKITSLTDLAKSGVKVALCVDTAPCGATAEQVFTNAKLTVKPVTQEADAKTTISKVTLGEADAAVVYVTDVNAATGVTGIEIPADVNATTEYPIATLTDSKNSILAAAFVAYVLSSTGQSVLTAAGFEAP
jgi:molybdate transport system substrate-binding protein